MNKEYLKIARMLYKPSHKVEDMVLNMIKFFKNKNISNIHFPTLRHFGNSQKLLKVKFIQNQQKML